MIFELRFTRFITPVTPAHFFQVLFNELKINWAFVKRDILAVVLPGLLFTAQALLEEAFPLHEWILYLSLSGLYAWLCLTFFCISNQLVGIEEDVLNKPDRPLVTGAVSLHGAWVRFALYTVSAVVLGLYLGVVKYSIIYLLCTLLHNFQALGDRWLTKNILTVLGILSTLCAAWQMVAPLTNTTWTWVGVIVGSWFVLAPLQDLRDIAGDLKAGRRTVPILLGELPSRILLCLGCLFLPLVVHITLIQPIRHFSSLAWDIVLAALSWVIAYRVLWLRNPQADRQTYSLFTGWHCLLLLSAFFLMH